MTSFFIVNTEAPRSNRQTNFQKVKKWCVHDKETFEKREQVKKEIKDGLRVRSKKKENKNDKTNHRKRKTLTRPQTRYLIEFFRTNSRPNKPQRKIISETLEVEERAIRVWFQNKRTKLNLTNNRSISHKMPQPTQFRLPEAILYSTDEKRTTSEEEEEDDDDDDDVDENDSENGNEIENENENENENNNGATDSEPSFPTKLYQHNWARSINMSPTEAPQPQPQKIENYPTCSPNSQLPKATAKIRFFPLLTPTSSCQSSPESHLKGQGSKKFEFKLEEKTQKTNLSFLLN